MASAQTTPTDLQITTINNSAGDQMDAHVSGNLVSYTSAVNSDSRVRYYNLSTHSDAQVPDPGSFPDFQSAVDGNRIVFTRALASPAIYLFDTASSSAPAEVAPSTNPLRRAPVIGGNIVAWQDFGLNSQPDIVVHDLTSNMTTPVTNDDSFDELPAISPDGSVLVWGKCDPSGSNCHVWKAVSPLWIASAVTTAGGEENAPSTNGTLIAYASTRSGEADIYWRPVSGGTESHLSLVGVQANARLGDDLITFDSLNSGGNWDVMAYDLRTNTLYQITTSSANENMSDVSVTVYGKVTIVYATDETGDVNVKAATFMVDRGTPEQKLVGLQDLIGSMGLSSGTANSLTTKLDGVLAKLSAGDTTAACNQLDAFINDCNAQRGKKLSNAEANQLINAAQQIRTALGC
jgi:Tol biopolymer transport system component